MGEILYTKFENLIPLFDPFPPSLSVLSSSPIPRVLGLGFRVHCGACELSSLASVIWLSLSLSLSLLFFSPGVWIRVRSKRKEKTNALAAVKEVVVWIVYIRTVATMAGGDTDMRSWADLLHNSSQLLHSYSPSAPLPPIQVSLIKKFLPSSNCKNRENNMRQKCFLFFFIVLRPPHLFIFLLWVSSFFCSFLVTEIQYYVEVPLPLAGN